MNGSKFTNDKYPIVIIAFENATFSTRDEMQGPVKKVCEGSDKMPSRVTSNR